MTGDEIKQQCETWNTCNKYGIMTINSETNGSTLHNGHPTNSYINYAEDKHEKTCQFLSHPDTLLFKSFKPLFNCMKLFGMYYSKTYNENNVKASLESNVSIFPKITASHFYSICILIIHSLSFILSLSDIMGVYVPNQFHFLLCWHSKISCNPTIFSTVG